MNIDSSTHLISIDFRQSIMKRARPKLQIHTVPVGAFNISSMVLQVRLPQADVPLDLQQATADNIIMLVSL